jgi:regulator of nucleoside diphosphate kinase
MNPTRHKRRCVNDSDRCRLGRLLIDEEPCGWADPSGRANLEVILEQAAPVKTTATPEDLVTMNTKVRLAELPTEKRRTVTLVYPDDVDLASDAISILEPLGTALLGSMIGDVIQCAGEKYGRRFRVIEIIYQPEHAGSFHL